MFDANFSCHSVNFHLQYAASTQYVNPISI